MGNGSQGEAPRRHDALEAEFERLGVRLRAVIDGLQDGVLLEDAQRRIVGANRTFCALFGIAAPPEALIGLDCAQAGENAAPLFADPAAFMRTIEVRLAEGRTVRGEELDLADGRVFERDFSLVRGDTGRFGVIWRYRDVTDQRRDARRLAETNALLEGISAGLMSHARGEDVRQIFSRLLKHVLELTSSAYGFVGEVLNDDTTRQPFLRTHAITDLALDADPRASHGVLVPDGFELRNLDTLFGAVMTSEAPVIANDAATDPRAGGFPPGHPALDAFLGLPFTHRGEIVGVLGLANRPGGYSDALVPLLEPFLMTCASLVVGLRAERRIRATEAQLRRAQRRRSALFDAALDGIVVANRHGRVLEVNPVAEHIFGYPREQLIGRRLSDTIVPPDLAARHAAGMARYLEGGEAHVIGRRVELRGRRLDGVEFPMELTLAELPSDDGPLFAAFVRDVTARRQATERLEAAHKAAQAANEAKSAFLATAVHELRTPMSAVIGLADAADAMATSDEQRRLLGRITASARDLLGIVEDLVDVERIEAGELRIAPAPTSVADLLQDLATALDASARDKGLSLELELAASVPPRVVIDGGRLRQILVNLVGNAIKFTRRGGVTVRAEASPTGETGLTLSVAVRDTGPGLPPDTLALIFDRFFRAGDVPEPGTGLGLAISRSLAERLGGRIIAESTVGRGSTFRVELPAEAAPGPAGRAGPQGTDRAETRRLSTREAAPPTLVSSEPRHVLVADDDPDARAAATAVLAPLGVRLDTARDGAEALSMASRHRYDLILTDLEMPALDGLALVRAVRSVEARRGEAATPIVALSARGGAEAHARSLAGGLSDHLTKPIAPKALREAVARWADEQVVVAYVEDDPALRAVFDHQLRALGARPVAACDGVELLELVARQRVSAALVDLTLPVLSGLETVKALRALDGLAGLPILAMSARAASEAEPACLAAGCVAYLPKPIARHQLAEALQQALSTGARDAEPVSAACVPPEIADLVPAFLEGRRRDLPLLRAALGADNADRLRVLGHTLRGTAATFGFDELAGLGAELERRAARGELAECSAIIERLAAALDAPSWVVAEDDAWR